MGPNRVLLVDDHPGFRASAVAFLEVEGMRVVGTAASGEEALTAVEDCRPDLVLVDLFLPGIDGVEVAARLAARPEPPAVILISSHEEAREDPRVRAAPVLGFLSKQDLTCAAILGLAG